MFGNHIKTLQKRVFSVFHAANSHIDLACNNIFQLKKTAFDSLSSHITIVLILNGNRSETLPEDIFNNRSSGFVDLGFNPLKEISRHFCEKQCVMESFRFHCTYLTLEDVDFIVDWARAKDVYLWGCECSQHNPALTGQAIELCVGAKNFDDAFSWQLYVWFF